MRSKPIQDNEILFCGKHVIGSEENLRALYVILGTIINTEVGFAKGFDPESFAEIRIYCQRHSYNFTESFELVPVNIFSVSKKLIIKKEELFWEKIRPLISPGYFPQTIDGNIKCSVPYTDNAAEGIITLNQVQAKFFRNTPNLTLNSEPGRAKKYFEYKDEKPAEDNFFHHLGYNILGPLFFTYGVWVLKNQTNSKCYGVMREGGFLSKVVSQLGGDVGPNLYLSRLSTVKAVLADPSEVVALENFLVRSRVEPASLNLLLEQLDLKCGDNLPFSPETLVTAENVTKVISWLNKGDILEQRIAKSERCRANLLHHIFTRTGDVDELNLLDMGYAGNILSNLSKVFAATDTPITLKGNFLVSSVGAVWAQNNNCIIRGYLSQNGAPVSFSRKYLRTPELLELCCSCQEGTTLGYEGDGKAVCVAPPLPDWQYKEIFDVQAGVLTFIRHWKEKYCIAEKTKSDEFEGIHETKQLQDSLSRLIEEPSYEEARHLGNWFYDESLRDGQLFKLYGNYKSIAVKKNTRSHVYWPQAAEMMRAHEK
ncbi:hypothetical protein [Kiloniella sp.]|uniref:hypothetical protein n=1 Tax=Kiloniella sp. TaxID=1938587 RepID=UPI003A901D4E